MAFKGPADTPGKHDHAVFVYGPKRQRTKQDQVFFNDARRFGVLDYTTTDELPSHPLLTHMGIDPFDAALTGAWLFDRLQKRKTPMKNILMDQTLIAGLGNIYVCEALFVSRIHPKRFGADVTKAEAMALVKAIRKVLTASIDAGGSSLRDYVHTDGNLGYFQNQFNVYGREGKACPRCKNMVARIVQAGRSTFFCPVCQI
jgi:formamidopyrimidine-DNA glycosylase